MSWENLLGSIRMAASTKTLFPDDSCFTEEWTIVLPRRGKNRRFPKPVLQIQQEGQSWSPADDKTDSERESKLLQKMQIYLQKLRVSEFATSFLKQMQSPDLQDRFLRVMGSEKKMQMVIYGIGSIESYEPPRLQLSLAILMQRTFDWIGEIEVFDPIISATESIVLTALGCSVLSVNEHGRRQVQKPTLFFMPHCEAELYENLLEVNSAGDNLIHLVLFGNSFSAYDQHASLCQNSAITNSRRRMLALKSFTEEFRVDSCSDEFFRAFHGSSWHFFTHVSGELN